MNFETNPYDPICIWKELFVTNADQSSAEFDVLEKINDDEIGEAPMISSRDMTAILGENIIFINPR